MTFFKKIFTLLVGDDTAAALKMPKVLPAKKLTERELIQRESEIGGQLFGPVASGCQRKFFNLDAKTWIWYEEYKDASGALKSITTRYEVQDSGILKAQEGARYSYLEGDELRNFGQAVQLYYQKVMTDVYRRNPATGQKFA